VTVYAATCQRFGSRLTAAEIAPRFRAAFRRQEDLDRAAGWRTDELREVARWRAIVREVLADVADPEECFQELFAYFARPDAWHCNEEAAVVLQQLAERGLTLGLASNFDERLRGIVAGLPALRPVQHLVISSEVGWRKPAAAFYREVCRRSGLEPEQILLVGDDRINDYEGARSAGLQAVLLDPAGKSATRQENRITRLGDLLH
jgi:putative hydrolase of the HAD superfamily